MTNTAKPIDIHLQQTIFVHQTLGMDMDNFADWLDGKLDSILETQK